jgi:Mitochondrial biogenesis AIM24
MGGGRLSFASSGAARGGGGGGGAVRRLFSFATATTRRGPPPHPRGVAATTAFFHVGAARQRSSDGRRLLGRCYLSSSTDHHRHLPVVEATTSKDGVVGIPIDFDGNSRVEGSESQILTVTLRPGQVLRAESGAMMYMTEGVTMNTTTGGGLSTGFQRMLTGQNFFVSDYTYDGEPGTTGEVALGTAFPSKILRLNVQEYGSRVRCCARPTRWTSPWNSPGR